MTLIPIAIFWVILLIGMARANNKVLLYMLFATMAMKSFAVIPTNVSGGLTLTGPPVVASFIFFKSLFRKRAIGEYLSSAAQPQMLGLLTLFWVVACAVTFFAPRYFLNEVEIIPMKQEVGVSIPIDKLAPTRQNISQMLYITISVITVFVFSVMVRNQASCREMLKGFRFGASATVLTGGLDFLSTFLPIKPLLELFRNGGYAMMTDKVINGHKRVVGLMTEASAFGGVCLFFLCFMYFSRHIQTFESKRSKIYYYSVMSALAMMLILSMSSSAYFGLAIFSGMCVLEWIARRFFIDPKSPLKAGLQKEFIVGVSLACCVILTIVVIPPIRQELFASVDTLILQKSGSESFEERNTWTRVSFQSLIDTHGIGCGLGSTRASNRTVAIFSNTGLLGGLLFYAFVLQSLVRRPRKGTLGVGLMHGVRWAFPATFRI